MDEISVDDMEQGEVVVSDDDKIWAVLGYIIPLVALVALLMEEKKERPFIRYHAIQSLILAVISIIASATICGGLLVWLYAIYVGIQAYDGKWVEVPFITDFAKGQGWL